MSQPFRSVGPSEPRCLTAGLARGNAEAKDRSGPDALGAVRPRHDPRVPSPPPPIPSSPPPAATRRHPPPSSVSGPAPSHCTSSPRRPHESGSPTSRGHSERRLAPFSAPRPPRRRAQLPRALRQVGCSVPSEVSVGAAAATFPRPQSSRAYPPHALFGTAAVLLRPRKEERTQTTWSSRLLIGRPEASAAGLRGAVGMRARPARA